jgi:hypothetical protein
MLVTNARREPGTVDGPGSAARSSTVVGGAEGEKVEEAKYEVGKE